ncbi:MAG TPA: hypothetical protein P5526_24785 [Anaerolineae bacterium]|nr:hypothetical protein [Anaerolineae bacterium]
MNTLQQIQTKLSTLLNRPKSQPNYHQAVKRAYARFSQQHPDWAASFFDDYFLTHTAAPILRCVGQGHTKETACALALAWSRQFSWHNESKQQAFIAELTPVAGTFLRYLEIELGLRTTAWRLAVQAV